MGFFSFMETSFFFTLAITFLLILLLVYHFKQRLVTSEEKQDTMFGIITNLVDEVNNIKTTLSLMNRPLTPYPVQTSNSISNEFMQTQLSEGSTDARLDDEIESLSEEEEEDDEDEDEEEEDERIIVSENEDEDDIDVEELSIEDTEVMDKPEEKLEVKQEKPNFSKMNLGALKTYITQQGWVEDASKMKKAQILTLIQEHNK